MKGHESVAHALMCGRLISAQRLRGKLCDAFMVCVQELNYKEDPEDGLFWMDKNDFFNHYWTMSVCMVNTKGKAPIKLPPDDPDDPKRKARKDLKRIAELVEALVGDYVMVCEGYVPSIGVESNLLVLICKVAGGLLNSNLTLYCSISLSVRLKNVSITREGMVNVRINDGRDSGVLSSDDVLVSVCVRTKWSDCADPCIPKLHGLVVTTRCRMTKISMSLKRRAISHCMLFQKLLGIGFQAGFEWK